MGMHVTAVALGNHGGNKHIQAETGVHWRDASGPFSFIMPPGIHPPNPPRKFDAAGVDLVAHAIDIAVVLLQVSQETGLSSSFQARPR